MQNRNRRVFIFSLIAVVFIFITWSGLGSSNNVSKELPSSKSVLNFENFPNKFSLIEKLEELDIVENEHPMSWIPKAMPQKKVNKSCPRYIMQDIYPGPGLGHVTGQWTTTLTLALLYNLTLIHSPIGNPGYVFSSQRDHGEYENLDFFLGMGLDEIQKKDFDFDKVTKIELRGGGMAPRSIDDKENFKVFTEDILEKNGYKCNILFMQPQFFMYDYSGYTKWIEVLKWHKNRELHPMETQYERNYINIAVHVRTGDIEPARGTPEIFFYTLLKKYIIPIIEDLPFRIYIYSEGLDSNRFGKLTTLPNVIERTPKDFPVFETFHHLIESDILIMARSGFSQFAAIFSHRPLVFSPPSRENFPLRFPPIGSIAATLQGEIESQDVMRIRRFRQRWLRAQEIKQQLKTLN